ncbi:MAG: signal recognition particle-docking protein FtsY [Bacteriovoracaceae bacterium]|nr:signal recognition particle-docking protein FtsY [Bacteriovoracaceae bacterium]
MIQLLQSIYDTLGIEQLANLGDLLGLGSTLFLVVAGVAQFFSSGASERVHSLPDMVVEEKPISETPAPIEKVEQERKVAVVPWSERLKKGLSRSRSQVWGKLGNLFQGNGLTDEQLEEIEELLYSADIGPQTATELTEALTVKSKEADFGEKEFKSFLYNFLKDRLAPIQNEVDPDLYQFNKSEKGKTKVIMVVGVNGAGKTTTIGKLATKLTQQGANVVVGACDTFRAAAVDQLQVWCDRAGATMIRAKEGSNPSGVGYEALQSALSQNADYCILDTAGRLHTKDNLMEELGKSKNVLKKLDSEAPHHVLLVIDAITGQNAIRQAEEFNKTLNLTGLIFTKCDGSSKAGSAVSIVQSLKVPIAYIGVGESVEDLNNFNLDEYLDALLDM